MPQNPPHSHSVSHSDYSPLGILCPGGSCKNSAKPHWYWVSDYTPFGFGMPDRSYSSTAVGYRYGFNSQEKDDEIYGTGNSYTAEFWQYDARLGRRWNVDPVDQISVSNYACFRNNPIVFIDIMGDSTIYYYKGQHLFTSHDSHENALCDLSDLPEKEATRFIAHLRQLQKNGEFDKYQDSDDFNKRIRNGGTLYFIDEYKQFFDENNEDYTMEGNGRIFEHATFLVKKGNEVRIVKEINIRGDSGFSVNALEDKDLNSGKTGRELGYNSLSQTIHTHPNSSNPPTDQDERGFLMEHNNVLVNQTYIWFYKKQMPNNERYYIKINKNNTFKR